jgi:hypothetical protein
MTEVIKTNDTGIDLKAAALPSPTDDDGDASPAAAPEPEPEPIAAPMPQVDPRLAIIASEDRVKRRELIMTIQGYYMSDRFGSLLSKLKLVVDLDSLTIAEMNALLREIEFAVANKGRSKVTQKMAPQIIAGLEPVVSTFYDVRGVARVLKDSETFKDIVEEIALQNPIFSHSSASRRLMFEVLTTCYMVHEMNAAKAVVDVVKEKPVAVSASTSALL